MNGQTRGVGQRNLKRWLEVVKETKPKRTFTKRTLMTLLFPKRHPCKFNALDLQIKIERKKKFKN